MNYFLILIVIIGVATAMVLFQVFMLKENNPDHAIKEILPTNNTFGQAKSVSGWVSFMDTNSVANIYLNYPMSNPNNEKDNIDNAVYLVNSTSLTLLKSPDLFITTNYLSTERNTTVVGYTITAKNNVTGIYGLGFSA